MDFWGPSATRDNMQSVSRKTSGLSTTTVQISLSSMHHQPESRLAQSQVHFQERPRCPPNYKLSMVADTIEPALVGGTDTFTLGEFQHNMVDGA